MVTVLKRLVPLAAAFAIPAFLAFAVTAVAASPSTTTQSSSATTSSGSGTAGATKGGAQGDATKGQTLYQSNCTSCHGANLEGGIGPKLNPIEKIEGAPSNPLDEGYLVSTITNGKQGSIGNMPPKGGNSSLSPQDIKDITAYIIQQNKTQPGAISPRELAISNVEWVTAGILALLLITWLLARYNMRWIARRANRG